MASKRNAASDFPCSLIIKTPFPTYRLATTALQALQVDEELSPQVRRTFSLITPPTLSSVDSTPSSPISSGQTVLLTEYRAKTNRMLRVAVNGFMESLGVVLGVMEKLDVDVLAESRAGRGDVSAGTAGNPNVAAAAKAKSTSSSMAATATMKATA